MVLNQSFRLADISNEIVPEEAEGCVNMQAFHPSFICLFVCSSSPCILIFLKFVHHYETSVINLKRDLKHKKTI